MKDFEFEGVKYILAEPLDKDLAEAEKKRLRALNNALSSGCFLESQVYDKARELNIWTEEKAQDLQEWQTEIGMLLDKIDAGGYDIEDAIEDALQVSRLRNKVLKSTMVVNELVGFSADRQGDIAYEDYILFATLKNANGKRVFKDFDKYMAAKRKDSPLIGTAIITKSSNDLSFLRELPENKFLLDYGRMDDDFNLLDEEGQIIERAPEPKEEVVRKPFTKDGKEIKPVTKVE